MNDPVNHPQHYTQGRYEVIDVIEDALGAEGIESRVPSVFEGLGDA